jgi:hypothetical protein
VRRLLPIAACAALGLALAACEKTINSGKLEGKLKQGIEKQYGIEVKSVDCPNNVKAKKGKSFTCTAHAANGQKQKFKITQDDDKGHVHYALSG